MYDNNNIFAKIIRGEVPCKHIFQNKYALSFYDINPKAPIHALVIPKGQYDTIKNFNSTATQLELVEFWNCVNETISLLNINEGFRLITNCGLNANQEVPHMHFHILAGKNLGPLIGNK